MMLYCNRYLFTVWQESEGSSELYALSSCSENTCPAFHASKNMPLGSPSSSLEVQKVRVPQLQRCTPDNLWDLSLEGGKFRLPHFQRHPQLLLCTHSVLA